MLLVSGEGLLHACISSVTIDSILTHITDSLYDTLIVKKLETEVISQLW